jgi:hypothetical protein
LSLVSFCFKRYILAGPVSGLEFYRGKAAIAVEEEQNPVDHCGNDGNLLPYSAIFILFTVHYNNYFDT